MRWFWYLKKTADVYCLLLYGFLVSSQYCTQLFLRAYIHSERDVYK